VAQLAFKNSLMSWLQKCFQTQWPETVKCYLPWISRDMFWLQNIKNTFLACSGEKNLSASKHLPVDPYITGHSSFTKICRYISVFATMNYSRRPSCTSACMSSITS
jgi:hypothetical protein